MNLPSIEALRAITEDIAHQLEQLKKEVEMINHFLERIEAGVLEEN